MFLKHWIFFMWIIIYIVSTSVVKKKLGIQLTKVVRCPNPVRKMDKSNILISQSNIRITGNHSSVVDINYNVTRTFGPLFVSLRVFQIQKDDKMKLIFKVDNATCKHPLTFQLIKVLNAPIDKNCVVRKGSLWIRDLDMDKFSWLLTKAAVSPGMYIYELEYIYENSCVYCTRLTCELFVK